MLRFIDIYGMRYNFLNSSLSAPLFRSIIVVQLFLMVISYASAMQESRPESCIYDNIGMTIICNSNSILDTITIPYVLNESYKLEYLASGDIVMLKSDSGTILEYDLVSGIWHKYEVVNESDYKNINSFHNIPHGDSPKNPFSNKILLPIYFLLGSSLIYGLIRIVLLKNEYDTKLNLEKLERSKVEEINKVKVDFYNMVSHELKTPLTLVIGPIQELKNNLTTQKDKILLDLADKNAKKLKNQIDEILDYKNHEFEYFDIKLEFRSFSDFVEEICLNFTDNAARKAIRIEYIFEISESYFHFDSKLMELVVNNLIVNALKFSSVKSNIKIRLWDDSKAVYFKITDTGTGIMSKDLPFIFEKYYQGNNKDSGSGIGLALVKEIVEKHKGDIDVKSRYRKGSSFTFHILKNLEQLLPQYVDDNSIFLDQNVNVTNSTNKSTTILIVDDNDDIRTYLTLRLQDTYNIISAKDGVEGYKNAVKNVPDVIISDVAMPNMDGITMCEKIKTDVVTNHIPVILLTVRARDKYLEKSLKNGADAYMTKPFDINILQQKIANILDQISRIQNKSQTQITKAESALGGIKHKNEFVSKFISCIKSNLENPQFSTDYIAELLNLSSSQSYRKIKSLTGLTPNQIIQTIRLEKAYSLILNSSFTISEIITKVGMNDPKYFRKKFKEKYKKTPSEVRKLRVMDS